jgi:hypothetical protein
MFINTGMCNLMIKIFFFQDLRMIDPNFVKLFKLAQLTIEYLLVCLFCVLSGEATNTNFLVFGLTRSGLKLTIYCTRGEHANHYVTDAVAWIVLMNIITTKSVHNLALSVPGESYHRNV